MGTSSIISPYQAVVVIGLWMTPEGDLRARTQSCGDEGRQKAVGRAVREIGKFMVREGDKR